MPMSSIPPRAGCHSESGPATPPGGADWLTLAHRHPLLATVPLEGLRRLLADCAIREYARDECVLSAGQANDTLYLVLRGAFHVILDPLQPTNRVAIGVGECFGEMSVIEEKPISATVVADADACALAMPGRAFWSALASDTGVARNLLRAMSERMRQRSELVITGARERLEFEAVQRELALAKEVQLSMLADGDALLKDTPPVEAAALMEPAHGVGGDFFDAFAIDAERVFVAVGDVAGKGISAALFMARSLATLRLEVLSNQPYESLLDRFNQALCEHNAHSTFVTLFAGFLDTKRHELAYFCAGHHASLMVSPDGTVAALPRPNGLVAGALPEADYALAYYPMQVGDILVAFSDGVTEAQNATKEFFGEARVVAALAAARPRTAAAAMTAIRDALTRFTGDAPQFDDITVLALRLVGDSRVG